MHPHSRSSALEAAYLQHHQWLKGWLRLRLGDSSAAADLAHDTFVRLLQAPPEQTSRLREPRAYLTTVANRLLIDHWRRQSVERAYLEVLAQRPEALEPSPEERRIVIETLLEIDAMLLALKPKVREAFLLAQLEGLTCPQVAARLGLSRATVERYLATALRHCYQRAFPA